MSKRQKESYKEKLLRKENELEIRNAKIQEYIQKNKFAKKKVSLLVSSHIKNMNINYNKLNSVNTKKSIS